MMENDTASDMAPLPVKAQEEESALKRLGPMQFTGGTFPLMGFFASAYEHISTQAGAMLAEWKDTHPKQD